jgi:hypothetical protein
MLISCVVIVTRRGIGQKDVSMPPATRTPPKRPHRHVGPAGRGYTDPSRLADLFIDQYGKGVDGRFTLRYWRGELWRLRDGSYYRVPDGEFDADLSLAIEADLKARNAKKSTKTGEAYQVTFSLVTNVRKAIEARTLLRDIDIQSVISAEAAATVEAA